MAALTPVIAIHVAAALGAVVTGPIALWARRGRSQHPKLHRAFGYAWVTLMVIAATSAIFIPAGSELPSIAGFSPIHLFVPVVFGMLFASFYQLAKGNIGAHRRLMQRLYVGACVIAGSFTLLPNRFLGHLVLGQWMGIA
ncbi:DUF2306 domain-containing protein [Caenimonas aquaedulcis]|uniref:DUF2306 domain-containing protein n=1 Tax=Caenimonas aquaedulcis TaxID=2793270 RepID=A0A931H383_9BURK|nr:DUF2306 domain-containing protein [Caenimonas aquaedulcis]MBG9387731.1 DUF2306 domain-containing protein [Caenimonas aquaedulcis]